jgi:histone H3/H4
LIPKASFARLVKEVLAQESRPGQSIRIKDSALEALQESAEALLVTEFEYKSFFLIILIFILISF